MRIVIVSHIFPARSETFVLQHVLGLRKRGHEVAVISKAPDDLMSPEECEAIDRAGVSRFYVGNFSRPKINWVLAAFNALGKTSFVTLTTRKAYDLRQRHLIALAMRRRITKFKPDIVHIHFGSLADDLLCTEGGEHLAGMSVVTWHGYDFSAHAVLEAHKKYEKLITLKVQHTVGTNFSSEKLQGLNIPKTHIRRIPMGIDLERFKYIHRNFSDTNTLRVLSVGRLTEMKDHNNLIQAVSVARNLGIPVDLRIIGDGSLRNQLKSQVQRLELSGHVEFLGPRPTEDVQAEMGRAHLFALPGIVDKTGKVENQGTVFCEAAATGLPSLGSLVGGVPDAVIENQTGKLCEPGNVDSIVTALKLFHENRQLLGAFSRNARSHAEREYSLDRMLDDFEALYRNILLIRNETKHVE